MPSRCLYPSADAFDPKHIAIVCDVIPSPRLHYYRPHVIVLVPFFWALRKEMMMFGTGSVPYRIDLCALCAERGRLMTGLRMAAGQERHPLY
jgi:hypothetical protein